MLRFICHNVYRDRECEILWYRSKWLFHKCKSIPPETSLKIFPFAPCLSRSWHRSLLGYWHRRAQLSPFWVQLNATPAEPLSDERCKCRSGCCGYRTHYGVKHRERVRALVHPPLCDGVIVSLYHQLAHQTCLESAAWPLYVGWSEKGKSLLILVWCAKG